MCDYSLHHVANRPAKIEDKLVATKFRNAITRGFAAVGQPNVAVCLLPGTEIAFDENVECEPSFGTGILPNKKIGQRVARFRQVNMDKPVAHHDALEFPDGQVVLVTRLCDGQRATVLQLPAGANAATAEGTVVDPVELTHWLAERIPYFMVPRYIRFVDALPKTPTERVQKTKLRDEGVPAGTYDREVDGPSIGR